jgi:prepilin-type N-terminal cleavage/methylation domain-containing protein
MKRDGFTLVELAIVMIVIGLLIGGIFSGLRLVENANVQKTINDIKAIESATLTFRDTYGRLPGDLRNPAVRLVDCTTPPCSLAGNGNRRLDPVQGVLDWNDPISNAMERYTYWSQLKASDLLGMPIQNSNDMSFGVGQPDAPIGGGYRMTDFGPGGWNNPQGGVASGNTKLMITGVESADMESAPAFTVSCQSIRSVDEKIDDRDPLKGKIAGWGCALATGSCCPGPTTNSTYAADQGQGQMWVNLPF